MTSNFENKLIKRLKSGHLDALEQVYRQYGEQILNQSYRILLSREAAEDVVHDIFVNLSHRLRNFKGRSSLGTWLYRVTHNHCLEKLRQERNRNKILREYINSFKPSEKLSAEDKDMLQRALETLEPETRSLLWLKDGEGLEIKELSQIMDTPEGTLKARLFREREKLRQWLQKEADYAT